jgi:hypothetical protein
LPSNFSTKAPTPLDEAAATESKEDAVPTPATTVALEVVSRAHSVQKTVDTEQRNKITNDGVIVEENSKIYLFLCGYCPNYTDHKVTTEQEVKG